MKERLKFLCWNCDREYSMTREIAGKPELIVACPFCEKEAVVDLAPYRTKVTPVYRGAEQTISAAGEAYNLPPVIPSTQPKG